MKDWKEDLRALETEHSILMCAVQEISTKLDFVITLLTGTEFPPNITKQNGGNT